MKNSANAWCAPAGRGTSAISVNSRICVGVLFYQGTSTIIALGEAAAWPVRFTVERFREEFQAKVKPGLEIESPNRVHALRRGGLEPVQIHVPVVERV